MKNKSLIVKDMSIAVKKAMVDAKEDLKNRHGDAVKKWIGGVLLLKNELERDVADIEERIEKIDKALSLAETGDVSMLKEVKVPSKYMPEDAMIMLGGDWRQED